MSPIVEMNVDPTIVDKMDDFDLIPSGTYEFQIRGVDSTVTGENSKTPGRPMLKWELGLLGPDVEGRLVWYNTVLPWNNNGVLDTNGCGLLVAITKGVGKPWTGSNLNTDEYLGLTGAAVVGQAPMKSGPRKGEMGQTTKVIVPK